MPSDLGGQAALKLWPPALQSMRLKISSPGLSFHIDGGEKKEMPASLSVYLGVGAEFRKILCKCVLQSLVLSRHLS